MLLVGRARSFSAVGHGEKLHKRIATDRGLGRFVAENAASIVYLPGGGSSWRGKHWTNRLVSRLMSRLETLDFLGKTDGSGEEGVGLKQRSSSLEETLDSRIDENDGLLTILTIIQLFPVFRVGGSRIRTCLRKRKSKCRDCFLVSIPQEFLR